MSRQVMTFKSVMLTIFWILVIWAAVGFFILVVVGRISLKPLTSKADCESLPPPCWKVEAEGEYPKDTAKVIYYIWFWPFIDTGGPMLLEE